MKSKGNAPNAVQKQWLEAVADLGSVLTGSTPEIHHCVGVTGKHNKVAIGHWWILPLSSNEHRLLHEGFAFGHESRKEFEKDAFVTVVQMFCFGKKDDSFPSEEVITAIEDYHR